jgi:hypothetical protein
LEAQTFVELYTPLTVEQCIKRIVENTALEQGFLSYTGTKPIISKFDGHRFVLQQNHQIGVRYRFYFRGELVPERDGTLVRGDFFEKHPTVDPAMHYPMLAQALFLVGILYPIGLLVFHKSVSFDLNLLVWTCVFYLIVGLLLFDIQVRVGAFGRQEETTRSSIHKFLVETLQELGKPQVIDNRSKS